MFIDENQGIPSPGVLLKSIGTSFFASRFPSWRQPHVWDAVSNSSKYYILVGTQLIQLYTFVCTIPTQNNNINLRSNPLTTYKGKGSDASLPLHHKARYHKIITFSQTIYL